MILEVKDLKKYYPVKRGLFYKTVGWIKAVDGVSFFVGAGETLGLVGESGCGKTTLGRLISRLIEPDAGSINFLGQEISRLPQKDLRPLRKDLQIIFQDPFTSLDPRFSVARIIKEGILALRILKNPSQIQKTLEEILEQVGLPLESLKRYPHEFSGGQRQRISIARSLVLNPKLLILDEPVSSLDVSIQAQIINLLLNLQQRFKLAYIFIAHDLNLVGRISDEVAVMYLGKIVEKAKTEDLFDRPLHPYTESLFLATPKIKPGQGTKRFRLKGEPASPINPPSGCAFHSRCPYVKDLCKNQDPPLTENSSRFYRCHFPL